MNAEISADPSVRPSVGRGWNNPIFRRYCRSRLRPKKLFASLLAVVMIASFITAFTRFVLHNRMEVNEVDSARAPVVGLLIFQAAILFVLGTAQAAGGMVAERDEGVIDYQRLIPMRPLSKVLGYLFGLPVAEYVLVFSTLPFTAWCLWKGEVAASAWLPLYGVFFSTALLYHCTGLVTGTVVKNRRWAFLVSIGLVFCLYTVIPQMAKFGLVFFRYLTITPVFDEQVAGLLPRAPGAVLELKQTLLPAVKFFGLNFSETVFTLFSQSGLVLTFLVMLCRKWRRDESHLLGKVWAVMFFIWIQILLLGNALPLIASGALFPSHGMDRYVSPMRAFSAGRRLARRLDLGQEGWMPRPSEAVLMAGAYGVMTLVLLWVFAGMLTPTPERQMRGWRHARKIGRVSLPPFSDAATATWFTGVMALAGAAGWYIFTRGLFESDWFPGETVPLQVLACFAVVLLAAGLGFQGLLEWRGGRTVGLIVILGGVAPVMTGAVVGVIGNQLLPLATWITGISAASLPVYAVESLLSLASLPVAVERAVPRAFQFWLVVDGLVTLWLMTRLYAARKAMAARILAEKQ